MSLVIEHLRSTVLHRDDAGLTDGQLLARFVESHDQSAIDLLVRRHGAMVWGVCRRILTNYHDAEDAFQATFLVLVRRAASVLPRDMITSWLHGVAYQTAAKARAVAAKRMSREKQVLVMPEPEASKEERWAELQPLLDRELSLLPDKYRLPFVLCDLEGKTRREAAQQAGVPEGTIAGRLARARAMLAKRLARHGITATGAALATMLEQHAEASVPHALFVSTARAASASPLTAKAAVSANVAALTEGVLKSMFVTKFKAVSLVLFILGVATIGTGGFMATTRATEPRQRPDESQPNFPELLHRLTAMDLQLQRIQNQVSRLEQKTQSAGGPASRFESYVAGKFKHRIPVEMGVSESKGGARIDILEVWGTRPKIEIGGQYLVHGKYALPSTGTLYFHESATNLNAHWTGVGIDLDLQYTTVQPGEGEFTLIHGMAGPGYFHLQLAGKDSDTFADIYFGTGDNVWRK
jgi:RNA polymerase sigma factor (sigma-70 family)